MERLDKVVVIDPEKENGWNGFVENHPFGWLCHLSHWKNILERSFGHMKGHYLVLYDAKTDAIKAGLPLFAVKSWLTGNRLVSIPFATLCDPLVSTSDDMGKLLDAALTLSNKLETSSMEIRTQASCPLIRDTRLSGSDYFKHHYLPLDRDPEQLKKNFHRTCVRQRISRAMNSQLKIKEVDEESALGHFYRLYLITRKRQGLPPLPYIFIKELWETFSPTRRVTILIAEQKDDPIAGILLLKFKDRVSVEFSVLDEAFTHLSPIHYLFWEAIQSAYYEGYKIFDFGRTAPSNHSLMDFKSRWGTSVINLPHFYYPPEKNINPAEAEKTIRYKFINTICKNAPDFAFQQIGRFCYRHMG